MSATDVALLNDYNVSPQVPAWMGGFSAAWAITVSLLLHLYNNSARDDRLVERIAPFVNALAISLPAMYLAAIVPMAYHCSRLYESSIEHVETIRDFLQTSAATFDGNFSLLDLAPMLGTAENLKRAYHGFEKWLRITFAYYAGSALLLVLVSSLPQSAPARLRNLRRFEFIFDISASRGRRHSLRWYPSKGAQ